MRLEAIKEEQMDSNAQGMTKSQSYHEKNLHLYPYLHNLIKPASVKDVPTKH